MEAQEPAGPAQLSASGARAPGAPGLPPAFHLFWAGQSLSAVGDAMTTVAMPLVMLAATGSVQQMGSLRSFALAGSLISTAGAGFVIDRWDARRIMIGCDVFRFVLMALVPLGWWYGVHSTGLLYSVGIGAALAEGIFYVGHVALVAQLVGRARAGQANGRVQATAALAFVVGPFLAGVLSAHLGPTIALGIDAGTFLVSALSLGLIRNRTHAYDPAAGPLRDRTHAYDPAAGPLRDRTHAYDPAASAPGDARASGPAPGSLAPPSPASIVDSLLVGWRFIRKQPDLVRLAIAMGAYLFFTASIVDILIYRLKTELGQGDAGVGSMFGIAAATSVVAAAVTPSLRSRVPFRTLWIAALVLQGCLLVATSGSPSFALMAGAASLFMAPMTMLKICQASIRQEVTPAPLLGRVSSTYLTLVSLPMPVGAVLATAIAARFGARAVQAGIGTALLGASLAACFLWTRAGSETSLVDESGSLRPSKP
jgi:MFS family permease